MVARVLLLLGLPFAIIGAADAFAPPPLSSSRIAVVPSRIRPGCSSGLLARRKKYVVVGGGWGGWGAAEALIER
jgi:hypothetical protein